MRLTVYLLQPATCGVRHGVRQGGMAALLSIGSFLIVWERCVNTCKVAQIIPIEETSDYVG